MINMGYNPVNTAHALAGTPITLSRHITHLLLGRHG
jgi:hypothetical protein